MYNKNTILTWGEYKNHMIKDIPIEWLKKIRLSGCDDKKLNEYLKKRFNIFELISTESQFQETFTFKPNKKNGYVVCSKTNKITYPLESDAKYEINRIKKSKSKTKPVRAYECSHCGGWHLTSQTKEEYNNKKEEFQN